MEDGVQTLFIALGRRGERFNTCTAKMKTGKLQRKTKGQETEFVFPNSCSCMGRVTLHAQMARGRERLMYAIIYLFIIHDRDR